MKKQNEAKTSWPAGLLVTGISFLAFSATVQLLRGSPSHAALFLKFGLVALVFSFFSWLGKVAIEKEDKKLSAGKD